MGKIKDSQRGFSVVEVLIAIFIVGLICAIGWFVFNKQTTSSQVSKPKEATNTVLQPEEVITKIKSTYESRYKFLNTDENNHPKQGEMSIRLSEYTPLYKAKGFDFYTMYEGGSSLSLMAGPVDWASDPLPREVDTTIRTEVAGTFKSFGLTKTGIYGSLETDIYTGRGLICTIESPASPTSSTEARCGRIDAYEDTAARIQPIARALPGLDQSTVLVHLQISDSKVDGYQKARVFWGSIEGAGGADALLYKKSNGPWVYFKSAAMALLCSEYNTTDIRNAFKGDQCYGAHDEEDPSSTVQ